MANSGPVVIASDQSTLPIGGNVAAAATDSGNPVKIGGKYNSTMPTYTTGQRGDLEITTRGAGKVALFVNDSATAVAMAVTNADGIAASSISSHLEIMSRGSVFNGTTWDRAVSVQGAADTISGIGLAAFGAYVYNGASWEKVRGDLGDASPATGLLVNNALLYNGSTYDRQRGDATAGSWVNIKGGFVPSGTALNTYSVHITTNTTTTPTSSTGYVSAIAISSEVAGTTSTLTIQDKQGTPLKLINGFSTTTLTTTPTIVSFATPVKMTSGIDIVTAGAVAATVDVWINYYQ
jgi:hypothetical protein